MPTSLRLAAIACASLGVAYAGSSTSTIPSPLDPAPSITSSWQFRVEPYLWLPSLNGTFGAGGKTTDVDLSLSDLFSDDSGSATYDLNAFLAIQLEARTGNWGLLADIAYLDLGVSGAAPGPRHLTANLDFEEFLGDLVATYRVADQHTGFLDLFAGARVNSLSLDLHAQADLIHYPTEVAINNSQSQTWVDPIIGVCGHWNFADKWFLAGKADIGGFGVSSDFLWSAQATVGYQFTEMFSAEVGYRHYDTDYKDDGFTYDLAMSGLFAGLNFNF